MNDNICFCDRRLGHASLKLLSQIEMKDLIKISTIKFVKKIYDIPRKTYKIILNLKIK